MKSFSISSLCQTARQSLSQTAHAQRTVLIYTGAIVGLTILAELLNLLDRKSTRLNSSHT